MSKSRSPRGERGLKFALAVTIMLAAMSLPSRGAWIEIAEGPARVGAVGGRSPRGERGLKF